MIYESGRPKCTHQVPPADDNVPTWNYAVVHVKGNVEIIEDPSQVAELMERFVRHFESLYETGWKLPTHEKAIHDLMKGIVVFKIKNLEFEGKFKLSQMRLEGRENVIRNLEENSGASELARYMKKAPKD